MKKSVNVYVSRDLPVSEHIHEDNIITEEKRDISYSENIVSDDSEPSVNTDPKETYTEIENKETLIHDRENNESVVVSDTNAAYLTNSDTHLHQEDKESKEYKRPTQEHQNTSNEKSITKHGEFVIVNKSRKKKKRHIARPDWNFTRMGSGQKTERHGDLGDSDLLSKESSYTPKEPDKVTDENSTVPKTETGQNDNEDKNTGSKGTVTNAQQTEKDGKDLGADIVVLIVIGVIAGIAGFSYIFSQLGLINR